MAVEITAHGGSAEARGRAWIAEANAERGDVEAMSRKSEADAVSGVMVGGVPYSGGYSVTPSEDVQVLQTSMRTLSNDVTILPIPSNYGLITYNGSVITVS